MQWQRNQVPEAALRKPVLVRENPVVRSEPHLWIPLHGQSQHIRENVPHKSRRLRLAEEKPEMRAISRARPLARDGKTKFAEDIAYRRAVRPPSRLVQIDRSKPHRVICEKRIASEREVASLCVYAAQVLPDNLVIYRQQSAIRTDRAGNALFVAEPMSPFDGAGGGVSALPRLRAHISSRIDVLASAEHRPEQTHLLIRRRRHRDDTSEERLVRTMLSAAIRIIHASSGATTALPAFAGSAKPHARKFAERHNCREITVGRHLWRLLYTI